MNRRAFLFTAAAALASAQSPSAQFPTEPRKRLSVSTYPFRSYIGHGGMTLQSFAASIPDTFHVPGIEPWSYHFESVEPDYVRGLQASFERAGVHVVNIPVDAAVHPCSAEADERAQSLATWRKWVDAAVLLRSPGIRVHLPPLNAPAECVPETMKAIAGYGQSKGIVINLENDDPRSEDAFRIIELIEKVGSPFLRALPDFANSMQRGDAEYDYRAVAAMFAHAYNISHVKDGEVVHGKLLSVSLPRTFHIAKAAGYRGYFSMEYEGELDAYQGTKKLIAASLSSLGSY
jgi:sugar phosphate isomerase/epimerase